jgi:hypothetical protein
MSEGLLSPGSSTSVASYHGPTPVIPPPATSILQQAAVAAEAAARQAKLQQPQQQREQPRQQRQQPLPAPSSWAAAGGQGGRYSAASPSLFGAAGSGGGEAYGGPVDVSSLWQAGDSSQDSLGSDPGEWMGGGGDGELPWGTAGLHAGRGRQCTWWRGGEGVQRSEGVQDHVLGS